MPPTLGNVGDFTENTTGLSETFSNNGDGPLIALLAFSEEVVITPTITYNGVSMEAMTARGSTEHAAIAYRLASPATGANTIAVSGFAAAEDHRLWVVSTNNAGAVTEALGGSVGGGTITTAPIPLDTAVDGLVLSIGFAPERTILAQGSGQTLIGSIGPVGDIDESGLSQMPSEAGTTTPSWNTGATLSPFAVCAIYLPEGEGGPTGPDTPTGFTAGTPTETSVPFTWTTPDNAAIDMVVQYKAASSGTWLAGFDVASNTSQPVSVTGLTAGTLYDFRARAENIDGESDWTSTIQATTATPDLPGVPTITSAPTADTAFSVTLATLPADTTEVRVYIGTAADLDPTTATLLHTFEAPGTIVVSERTAATTYYLLPEAVNAEGETEGTEISVTTFTAGFVQTLVSGDALEIPYNIESGREAEEYRVRLGKIIRALAGLGRQVDIRVRVRTPALVDVADETFLDVANVDLGELEVIPITPPVEGPITLTAVITATIAAP